MELTVMVIGYDEHGNIIHTRCLPTFEDETGSLVRSIGGVFRNESAVKTVEVKLDISTQVFASSKDGLGQLEQLLKLKFESFTLTN